VSDGGSGIEALLAVLRPVGFTAAGLVVLGWLVVSFLPRGRARSVLEWASTIALYVALASLFANLVARAHAAGNWLAVVAFGLLLVIFVGGLCVSLAMMVRELTGTGGAGTVDATH